MGKDPGTDLPDRDDHKTTPLVARRRRTSTVSTPRTGLTLLALLMMTSSIMVHPLFRLDLEASSLLQRCSIPIKEL